MKYQFPREDIPHGSVLGLNYSGMHDTAISLVSPEGVPLFSVSLERFSRVKQDGRLPEYLFEILPWERISQVALAVAEHYTPIPDSLSKFHPIRLKKINEHDRSHGAEFWSSLEQIPVEKVFIPHHLSHAASSFWLSGFSSATCLVYDGGMSNEEWFGGVYTASIVDNLTPVDLFSALKYPMVTSLYTAITAILGFTPLKHEGKVTGLAAYGTPHKKCRELMDEWLENPELLDDVYFWHDKYSQVNPPHLKVNFESAANIKNMLEPFTREDVAATVQDLAEEHVLSIIRKLIKEGVATDNLCLSGGLFANVKINQRASELGFKNMFVAPPMTDDGAALGAAFHVVSQFSTFSPPKTCSMFLGPSFESENVSRTLSEGEIKYHTPKNLAQEVAKLLDNGSIVAVFQGALEFGPRSLGNRSILVNADDPEINLTLNKLLNRTEFMPFAPISLDDDAERLYFEIDRVRRATGFMTVTVNCTSEMKELCPAAVHCDGTARPQLVTRDSNPFIYDVISSYKSLSGKPALVNTSFNIHEEPIVCTPEDAIKGFFESGIDALCIEGHLVKLTENLPLELGYVRNKLEDVVANHAAFKKQKQEEIISVSNDQKDSFATEIRSLVEALEERDEGFNEVERRRHELEMRVQTLQGEVAQHDEELKKVEHEREELLTQAQSLQGELAQRDEGFNEVERRGGELEDQVRSLQSELTEREARLTKAERRGGELEDQVRSLQSELTEREARLAKAERQGGELEKQVVLAMENHDNAIAAGLQYQKKLVEVEALQNKLDDMQQAYEAIRESRSWRLLTPVRYVMNFLKGE